jgi:hypothetical protein
VVIRGFGVREGLNNLVSGWFGTYLVECSLLEGNWLHYELNCH